MTGTNLTTMESGGFKAFVFYTTACNRGEPCAGAVAERLENAVKIGRSVAWLGRICAHVAGHVEPRTDGHGGASWGRAP
jgi:hypothetical protein